MGASHASELPPGGNVPKPRLAWLALFQLAVIAAVVALARITRGFSGPPTLEDRLSAVGEKSLGSAVQSAAWGGRGWLVAVVAMAGALLLMLPIAWAYVATRERRKVDHSVVTTITLLPIAVAAILVIVQDSLAIAFSQDSTHEWFVFEARPHRLTKSLSDLNGTDPHIHGRRPEGVLRALANALVRQRNRPSARQLNDVYDDVTRAAQAIRRELHADSLFAARAFDELVVAGRISAHRRIPLLRR